MAIKRKIILAINQVPQKDGGRLDIEFWLSKSPAERLAEVARLRRLYYSTFEKPYPEKMEKVVSQRKLR